jgi:hypothetical protein
MALREQCPNCEKLLVVRGPGRVICPKCRHIFEVPDLGDGLLPREAIQTAPSCVRVAAEPVAGSSTLVRVGVVAACFIGLAGGAVGLAFLLAPKETEPAPPPRTIVTVATEPAPAPPPPPAPPQPSKEEIEITRLRDELARSKEEQSRLEEEKRGGQSELLILQAKVRRLEETVGDQKKRIAQQDAALSKERQERTEAEGALKTQLQLSEAVAKVRAEQIQDLRKAKVREEEPEPPPQETDPRVRAALIGIAQKMKKDIDARAWAKLELHEREAVDEVLYRFAQSRLHHGNGLDALSAEDVGFMKKAGLAGYVRMEEARRRPKK